MGAAGAPHATQLAPPLFKLLGDSRKASRDAASEALDQLTLAVTSAPLLLDLPAPLLADSSLARRGALAWFNRHHSSNVNPSATLAAAHIEALAAALVAALQDRAAEVRQAAQTAIDRLRGSHPAAPAAIDAAVASLPTAFRLSVEANLASAPSSPAQQQQQAKQQQQQVPATPQQSSAIDDVPPAGSGLARSPSRDVAVAAVAATSSVDELSSPALTGLSLVMVCCHHYFNCFFFDSCCIKACWSVYDR
jgi:hypothetical protein